MRASKSVCDLFSKTILCTGLQNVCTDWAPSSFVRFLNRLLSPFHCFFLLVTFTTEQAQLNNTLYCWDCLFRRRSSRYRVHTHTLLSMFVLFIVYCVNIQGAPLKRFISASCLAIYERNAWTHARTCGRTGRKYRMGGGSITTPLRESSEPLTLRNTAKV